MDDTTQEVSTGQIDNAQNAAPVAAQSDAVDNAVVATAEDTATLSVENLQKQLKETRKEAANYRRKLREIEEAQQAQLAELERTKPLEERLQTYEQQLSALQAEKEDLETRAMLSELNDKLLSVGVARESLDDALDLYLAAIERTPEDDDPPTLEDWLKTRPYLMAQTRPAPTPLPGANPAGKQVSAALTREDIRNMTPEQYAKERSRLFAALTRGNIR